MRIFTLSSLLLIAFVSASNASPKLENHECKACHPKIYKEYQGSHHANSTIYKNEIFNAIWKKHPAKKANNFKCAKCHTPSDHAPMKNPSTLAKNEIQMTESISYQHCHQIESVEKHTKSNKNILTKKEETFFASDLEKKGTKLEFKEKSIFFRLFTTKICSPYHDIDYSNKDYYAGNSCMGCHAHKQNSNDFTICDLKVKESEGKDTCVTCHMPQVSGSMANQKVTRTHAFHSSSALISKPALLSRYILLDLKKADFVKVIGDKGKPTFPWLATEIIKDSSIKAFEKRVIAYEEKFQNGDRATVEFGYHIVNPKIAKKLELKERSLSKFVILTKKILI